ncbi:hypothetical protein PIB30_013532 [Stylosanthes scabra]|uniref:Uncharacterized protein n=1 Tax=Stylosanthes scabra TaxID=79078 RepID=A0ABU6R5G2_9FABA|nr:hypothetical protein [Stylosanthes scabra]
MLPVCSPSQSMHFSRVVSCVSRLRFNRHIPTTLSIPYAHSFHAPLTPIPSLPLIPIYTSQSNQTPWLPYTRNRNSHFLQFAKACKPRGLILQATFSCKQASCPLKILFLYNLSTPYLPTPSRSNRGFFPMIGLPNMDWSIRCTHPQRNKIKLPERVRVRVR